MSAENRRCVVIYTKPAVPGRVKTRLIGELRAEQAAELHSAFLGDLLECFGGGRFELRVAWALAPEEELPAIAGRGWRQEGADLGQRLYNGLLAAARGHDRVVAVGSDHPDLPLERLDEAFARLDGGADVALGPADDGGYYLVGLRAEALRREIFEGIEWSTDRVLEATLVACRRLGLSVALLAEGHDVDTPGDLARLAVRLAAAPGLCPRTRRLLAVWGRLPAPGG